MSLTNDTLDTITRVVHTANAKWWVDPKTGEPLDVDQQIPKKLLLIHSEISEAVEGHRKNLKDDKLPQFDMLHVELVDALIRIFDLAGALKMPMGEIFDAKMQYNNSRVDHSHEIRNLSGGKQY